MGFKLFSASMGILFWSNSRIFRLHRNFTISGEGLYDLTYNGHSWPLNSERSIACHTNCETGHPFIMVIIWGPVTLTPIAERLAVELSLPLLCMIKICRGLGSKTQFSAFGANALTHCATAAVASDQWRYNTRKKPSPHIKLKC